MALPHKGCTEDVLRSRGKAIFLDFISTNDKSFLVKLDTGRSCFIIDATIPELALSSYCFFGILDCS